MDYGFKTKKIMPPMQLRIDTTGRENNYPADALRPSGRRAGTCSLKVRVLRIQLYALMT